MSKEEFLSTDMQMTPAPTSIAPQMDPGQKDFRHYVLKTIVNGSPVIVAQVIVPKYDVTIGGALYSQGMEYWHGVSATAPQGSLIFEWRDFARTEAFSPSPSLGARSFRMSQAPPWTSQMTLPALSATTFGSATLGVLLSWQLTRNATGTWGGALVWYSGSGQNNVFASSGYTGSATLVANTVLKSGACYTTSVGPI